MNHGQVLRLILIPLLATLVNSDKQSSSIPGTDTRKERSWHLFRNRRSREDATDTVVVPPQQPLEPLDTVDDDINESYPNQLLFDGSDDRDFERDDSHDDSIDTSENDSYADSYSSDTDDSPRTFEDMPYPVAYRYYGRNTQTRLAGRIPFIIVGPNVEHWKATCTELASRGYSVIVCERVIVNEDGTPVTVTDQVERQESADLVLELMDALRWNKVILVGCDQESLIVVQAAMQLSPQRVSGVVLCGSLGEVERYVAEQGWRVSADAFAIDSYLQSSLACPFTIIWDGGDQGPSRRHRNDSGESQQAKGDTRSTIIGAGSAPHRKKPEFLSWVLSRFVEEKILVPLAIDSDAGHQHERETTSAQKNSASRFFSTETLTVIGRIAAGALWYASFAKICMYQYESTRDGFESVYTFFDKIPFLRRATALGSVVKRIPLIRQIAKYLSCVVSAVCGRWKKSDDTQSPQTSGVSEMEDDVKNDVDVDESEVDDVEETENPSSDEAIPDDRTSPDEARPEVQPFQPRFFLDRVVT